MSAYPESITERRDHFSPQSLDPQNQLRILPLTLPDSASAWETLKRGNTIHVDFESSRRRSQNSTVEFSGFESKLLEAAEKLVRLPDDWDDDGGTTYSSVHAERVVRFVRTIIESNPLHARRLDLLPRISPGPGTSIDVFWQLPKRELLLNFPSDVSGFVTYSGEALGGEQAEIRGVLDTQYPNEWLAAWLFGHDTDHGVHNASTPAYAVVEPSLPQAAIPQQQ